MYKKFCLTNRWLDCFASTEDSKGGSNYFLMVITGLEFYKAVRKEELLKNSPFIMFVAKDCKEKVIEIFMLEIKDYIVKHL